MVRALQIIVLFLLFSCSEKKKATNIIYILADDLGYGEIGVYGQTIIETPHLDSLARGGLLFTQHYSGSPVCAPSRSVLLTGKHSGHTYIRGNDEWKERGDVWNYIKASSDDFLEGQRPIPDSVLTFAEVIQEHGYKTAFVGKWGLGAPGTEGVPNNQGFGYFFGYNCQRQAHTFYPSHLWSDRKKVNLDGKTYSHTLIAEECLKFIRKNKAKPFFCYVPFTIPHAAMHAPEERVAPWRKKFPEFENVIGRYRGPQVKNPVAAFAAMMTLLDEDVGRILDLLEELGIAEDTLVIFTSDNGPHKEGGHKPDVFDSNGPLRGYKRDLYEGGIRVATVAWWPGKIKPGSVSGHIGTGWDVLPTFCELAEIKTPKGLDGLSFAPTLLGQKQKQGKRDYVYWEFHERGGKQAVRKGKWKAVRLGVRKNADAPIELYDLSKDIGEIKNVADKHPELVKELSKVMADSHTTSPTFRFLPGE